MVQVVLRHPVKDNSISTKNLNSEKKRINSGLDIGKEQPLVFSSLKETNDYESVVSRVHEKQTLRADSGSFAMHQAQSQPNDFATAINEEAFEATQSFYSVAKHPQIDEKNQ